MKHFFYPMKILIDKIPVEMFRTVHKKDAYGNRIKDREKYIGNKKIRCVDTGRRIGHYIIDFTCFQIIYQVFMFLIGLIALVATKDEIALLTLNFYGAVSGLILFPAYYFFFEYKFQKTPGKWITGTIVVNQYGEKLAANDALLRTMIRLVPFEPFSCFSDSNRGWHDKWSNTYVLQKKEYEEIKNRLKELNAENELH